MAPELWGDAKIIESWRNNVVPWTAAVRERQIQSREAVTNQAIVDAILACSPRSVLDLGCGEGWLARVLEAKGMSVMGVDAIAGLVDAAQRGGPGRFEVLNYEQIAGGLLKERADAVVCNFSLIGKESVEGVFAAMPSLLTASGCFIVQTLHPLIACGDLPYEDGWRAGSWNGFAPGFTDPAPWYFRTLSSWMALFAKAGLRVHELHEPLNPNTRLPMSVIFTASLFCSRS